MPQKKIRNGKILPRCTACKSKKLGCSLVTNGNKLRAIPIEKDGQGPMTPTMFRCATESTHAGDCIAAAGSDEEVGFVTSSDGDSDFNVETDGFATKRAPSFYDTNGTDDCEWSAPGSGKESWRHSPQGQVEFTGGDISTDREFGGSNQYTEQRPWSTAHWSGFVLTSKDTFGKPTASYNGSVMGMSTSGVDLTLFDGSYGPTEFTESLGYGKQSFDPSSFGTEGPLPTDAGLKFDPTRSGGGGSDFIDLTECTDSQGSTQSLEELLQIHFNSSTDLAQRNYALEGQSYSIDGFGPKLNDDHDGRSLVHGIASLQENENFIASNPRLQSIAADCPSGTTQPEDSLASICYIFE